MLTCQPLAELEEWDHHPTAQAERKKLKRRIEQMWIQGFCEVEESEFTFPSGARGVRQAEKVRTEFEPIQIGVSDEYLRSRSGAKNCLTRVYDIPTKGILSIHESDFVGQGARVVVISETVNTSVGVYSGSKMIVRSTGGHQCTTLSWWTERFIYHLALWQEPGMQDGTPFLEQIAMRWHSRST